ncbi:serine/threonine-protein kinase 31 [Echinops telfairi]|uniref:Serine/threonine-protein kinase 31 n=1 Tax=Echinops telfairi TaxID=9371 RepID=A0ABM0ILM3_ECHTE|nr:serine/threonine-protein kinase 31 [Echinops telfairi]
MWGRGHFTRASVMDGASFSGITKMDEDPHYNKVEDVVGSHVEDAVTFWAQSINRNKDIVKIGCSLSEVCPHANSVFGNLDSKKIYGGLFSEDKCWYRCKVLKVINDEKCLVRYVDYGNTEILNRSDIVEIPVELQFPSVAKKYRLWGLQIPSGQEVTQFDQGRTFLGSLIFEKEIKMRIKATYQDGTVIAQAEYGNVDIGEEVAKKGYAEKCKQASSINICEEKKSDAGQLPLRNLKSPIPLWGHRSSQSSFSRPKGRSSGRLPLDLKMENNTGNHMTFPNKQDCVCTSQAFLQSCCHILTQEKATTMDLTKNLESTLKTCVGTRMKELATKVELLKGVRHVNTSVRFGDDLSAAVQLLDAGCLPAPASLNELERIWAEYNLAQEKIQACQNVNEGNILIARRNEVQQRLYTAVKVFILEVDELPLNKRLETLQDLSASLEAVYGQTKEGIFCEEVLKKFYEWKCGKLEEFTSVRSETQVSLQRLVAWFHTTTKVFDLSAEGSFTAEDTIDNIDEILENTEACICKELEMSLIDQGDADKEIILNTYNQVLQRIHSEEKLIATIQSKYKESVEFKKQISEWLNKSPSVDHLLSIKKTLKGLKARLRWKLVEKNNLEESDDPDGSEIEKIKQEIIQLHNSVFQEIYHEQEEYAKLNSLVQQWFPELPLLHPEIGLHKYMNSGGLLTLSLERDLLDAEPLKELSSKRPLVCSEVNGQVILLKGYSVDVDTEAKVIQRAAEYHRAWRETREESGLLPLIFLFLCKSDPMAYLMVPYYPRANLSAIQASTPLTPEETAKVMKGVAQGLRTLHKAGIIHGALHQNNVFALNREQGIVGDFDFSKSVSQRASVNMRIGNLSLLSPELKMGQPASPGSDLYAYGCLLLWLSVQSQDFKTNEDGIPDVDPFNLDEHVKSLLFSLISCRSSVTADQVLNAEYFLPPKVANTFPNAVKDTGCTEYIEEEEFKMDNLNNYKEKTKIDEANNFEG